MHTRPLFATLFKGDDANRAAAAAAGRGVGTGEYYMAAGSGGIGGDTGSTSGSSAASAAKAKIFFEQWEEDKGMPLGGS